MKKKAQIIALAAATALTPTLSTIGVASNHIVLANNNSQGLSSQNINVTDVWNYGMFSIGFNSNNTFNITKPAGAYYTNPYYTGNDSLQVIIRKKDGQDIYNKKFGGKAYPYEVLKNDLNNKSFKFGDIITLISKSGAHFNIGNNVYTKEISYEITENGLEKVQKNLFDVQALYNGDNVSVTGITAPSIKVDVIVGDKTYSTRSNIYGSFNLKLSNSIKPGKNITINPEGYLEEVYPVNINRSKYKIVDSSIELYGNWGSIYKVTNIGFNPLTMKFNAVSEKNNNNISFCGYTWENAYTVSLLNSAGQVITTKSFKGGATSGEFNSWINSQSFSYGDYLEIHSRDLNMSLNGQPKSTTPIYAQITKNGLEKVSNGLKSVKALYEGNKTVVTGMTSADTEVYITANGKVEKTTSNSSGEFNIDLSNSVKPGTIITIQPNGYTEQSATVTIDKKEYPLVNSKIDLYGNWGTIYSLGEIEFNPYTMKMEMNISVGRKTISGAPSSNAYELDLYNSQGKLVSSKLFKGKDTNKQMATYLGGLSFNYGDYFKVTSYGLETAINGGIPMVQNIFGQITKEGFKEVKEPTLSIDSNILNIKTYNNATAFITINGKTYSESTEAGTINFTIPEGTEVGTPITVSIKGNGFETMPLTVYSRFNSTKKNFDFNMFRYASIAPSSPVAVKGDDMTLTSNEPLPLQFSGKSSITVDVTGDVKGKVAMYLKMPGKTIFLGDVQVNNPTNIEVPSSGILLAKTGDVDYKGNQEKQFKFNINVAVNSGYYREIPVFDNRRFIKEDNNAFTNSKEFYNYISKPGNSDNGAIVIGDHVRILVDKASSLGTDFNADNTVGWYNQAFVSDNKLNGLSQNASSQLNKFHTNFFYVTTDTSAASDGWFTGSDGTVCIPSMFSPGLTKPGWVMFHEVGHIFDPVWADSYLGCEVYSNMYTQETQLNVQGKTSWLYKGLNSADVTKNIGPIFKKYYSGVTPENYLHRFSPGLYYFTLLKQYFPDYMEKTDDLYRTEKYNNSLPFTSKNYLAYAMAKIYHVNILPSLDMWGYKITNQSLINYVLENASKTVNLVPKESAFDVYRDTTVAPTTILPIDNGDSVTIKGMVNPGATVYVDYENKDYKTTCNAKGSFTITLKKSSERDAVIWAKTGNKLSSLKTTITINRNYTLNNRTFTLRANDANGGPLGTISLNSNNTLKFISTQGEPNWKSMINVDYMNLKVLNTKGEVLYKTSINTKGTFGDAINDLNNMNVKPGYEIVITAPNKFNGANVYSSSLLDSKNVKMTPKDNGNGYKWTIIVTNNGLEYITAPKLNCQYGDNVVKSVITPGATLSLMIKGKTYEGIAKEDGTVSIKVPELQGGQKIIYHEIIGNKVVAEGNTNVTGKNASINIENVWKQELGKLTFNYKTHKINVDKGWSEVNPYEKGTSFVLTLEGADGAVIRTITGNGGDWISNPLYDTFNGVKFKAGDKFIISYDGDAKISASNILDSGKVINDNSVKNVTYYITNDGVSLKKSGRYISSVNNNIATSNNSPMIAKKKKDKTINSNSNEQTSWFGNIANWMNQYL